MSEKSKGLIAGFLLGILATLLSPILLPFRRGWLTSRSSKINKAIRKEDPDFKR